MAHPECLNMLNPATSNSDLCSEKSGIAKLAAQSPHSPFGVRSLGCFCPATAGEVTFSFWESHAKEHPPFTDVFCRSSISNKFLPRCSNGKVILFSSLVAPKNIDLQVFYLVSSEYNIQVAKSYIKLI
jgi:hypothetical protein